jgi:hypothetical protein
MAKKGTLNDLEAKLADRAEANVQSKIDTFKKDIEAALAKLFGPLPSGQQGNNRFGDYYYYANQTSKSYDFQCAKHDVLQLAICDCVPESTHIKKPWPSILWTMEHCRLRDELLAKMDLMQQLFNAPVRDTSDDVPHTESEA